MSKERYPLAPLAQALGVQVGPPGVTGTDGHPVGHGKLALLLGCDIRTIRRYAADGIPEASADRYAVRAGRLPYEVWPDYYERAVSDEDDE